MSSFEERLAIMRQLPSKGTITDNGDGSWSYSIPMDTPKILFKKLEEAAVLPSKKHITDACWDLTAVSRHFMRRRETDNEYVELEDWMPKESASFIEYKFGFAAQLPPGWCALIFPRSSITETGMTLANCVAVYDESYRGEWRVRFRYDRLYGELYEVGKRVAQVMFLPRWVAELEWADKLDETDRSEGAYGSTGR